MRKLFLIVMMFLLPHQYAWAMAANYDAHDVCEKREQAEQAHFGHHVHQVNLVDLNINIEDSNSDTKAKASDNQVLTNQSTTSNQSTNSHIHHGFCHLSCGEVLSYSLPVFEALSVQFLSQYSLVYHAPTSHVLDRPKWLQLI
ncbi:MAG TPA: hypothetical protein VES38_09485 [Methylotenera sp.]|nr:hypothetical protein [Methylotenera sp.]